MEGDNRLRSERNSKKRWILTVGLGMVVGEDKRRES